MTFAELINLGHSRAQALVAEKLLEGLSNDEIASNLAISNKTVKFHCTQIYRKFGVVSRSQYMAKMLAKPKPSPIAEDAVWTADDSGPLTTV